MPRRPLIVSALLLTLCALGTPARGQTVYGLFGLPSPDIGSKQLGVLEPTTGGVTLEGTSTSIDADAVSVGTGITAIAVAGEVFYFVGTDGGDGLSKVYTVDLDTGATAASHTLSAYSASTTLGLWYDPATATLWGLFSDGGDRALAAVDPTTGAVAAPVNGAIVGEPVTTAGGVFTGDPAGGRVFLLGTPDSGEPTLYEVATGDGAVTPWLLEEYNESTVMGLEWDATLQTLWLIVHRGSGRQLAHYDFDEMAVLLALGEIDFGDTITTSTGLTTLDDDSGQLFFIGRPDLGSWSVYTVDVPSGEATHQAIDGSSIQVNGWVGFEIVPGPDLAVTKDDGGASAVPGDTVTWTVTVANAADAGPAVGVELTEVVPDETTFSAAASTAGWSCADGAPAGSTCTLARPDIAPGADDQVTFAVVVDASVSPDLTQLSNTVVVSAANTTGDVEASDTTPITAAADVTFTKSDGGVSAGPGHTVVYTLTAANNGDADAVGSVIAEVVPAETTFDAGVSTAGWSCPDGSGAGTACTLAVGTIEGGAQVQVAFAVIVVPSVSAGTEAIANLATLTADNQITEPAFDTTPVTAAPTLVLDKSDGDVTAAPGDVVPYLLSYANSGDEDASGATLTEVVPAQTTFVAAASTAGWSCAPDGGAGSTCTLAIGTVDGAGGSGSATFAVRIDPSVTAGTTQIANSATLDAANAPAPAVAADTTPVTAAPELALVKSDGDVTTVPGRWLTYVLLYRNDGDEDAADVVVTETVPADTTFVAADSSPGWICTPDASAGSTCTWDVGTLAGGDSGFVFFAVAVDDPYLGAGEISNTAGVDASNATAAGVSDTTPVDARLDLAVAKDDLGIIARPGGTIAYRVTWSNVGTQSASGVEVTETVPADTTFDAGASSAGWVCVPDATAGSTCTLAIPTLAPGALGSAVFAVTVDDPTVATSIANTVTIADDGSLGADVEPTNDSDTVLTPVDLLPPEVTLVDTVPTVGSLAPCDQVPIEVDTLAVTFADDSSGVVGADDLGSYIVVAAGVDGEVTTAGCGPVLGDDVEIPLAGVTVGGGANAPTATLSLSSSVPDGLALVLVCDTVSDAAGNALDGDGDGQPGGDLAVRFRVDAGNLFANAHLDDCPTAPITLVPWAHDAVPPGGVAATLVADIVGSSQSGAIEVRVYKDPITVGQCVDTSAAVVEVEAWVRGASDQLGDVTATLSCSASNLAACAGMQTPVVVATTTLSPDPSPAWQLLDGIFAPGAGAASIRCDVTVTVEKEDEVLELDDLFLGLPLFADGFEDGTTQEWSAAVP